MDRSASESGPAEPSIVRDPFSPGSTPVHEPQETYDWPYLAAFSIVIPLLIGLLAILPAAMGLVGPAFAPVWMMLFGMIPVGFVAAILPLFVAGKQARPWVRQSAAMGFTLNCFCFLWLLGAVAIARTVAHYNGPAGKAERAAWQRAQDVERQHEALLADQRRRDAARLAEELQRKEDQALQQRIREDHERQLAKMHQDEADAREAIERHDPRMAERFQRGDEVPRVPPVPIRNSRPPVIKHQPLQTVTRPYHAVPSGRSLLLPEQTAESVTLHPLAVTLDKFLQTVVMPEYGKKETAYFLQRDGKLLEVSTLDWTVTRELDLGGPCSSMVRLSKSMLVARTRPGAVLHVESKSLAVTQEIPIANLRFMAAEPEGFCILTDTLDCELGIIRLDPPELISLLSLATAERRAIATSPATRSSFSYIQSSDGENAAALANWWRNLKGRREAVSDQPLDVLTAELPEFGPGIAPSGALKVFDRYAEPDVKEFLLHDAGKPLQLTWLQQVENPKRGSDNKIFLVADSQRMYLVNVKHWRH